MKIDIEHIEELMFDYYEGNLSEQEKTDLLNLIHQHPEYEAEFTHWAQSYAHVDHDLPDYGLTSELLKKPALSVYLNKRTLVLSILLFTTCFLYWYLKTSEQEHRQAIETVETHKVGVVKEQSNTVVSTLKTKGFSSIKENNLKYKNTILGLNSNENTQVSGAAVDTLIGHTDLSDKRVDAVVEKQKVDSLASKNVVGKPNIEGQEKKKVKYKSKFNLKPSPDFIPTNPNF